MNPLFWHIVKLNTVPVLFDRHTVEVGAVYCKFFIMMLHIILNNPINFRT